MVDKKSRLIEKAKQNVRQPKTPQTISAELPKSSYKVVAVSLYTPEADWIDQTTKVLQLAGNPKANRSLVVREAILRLQQQLQEKSPDEIVRDFTEHHAQRMQKERF